MDIRRWIVATAAVSALCAHAPADAVESFSMDGKKTRTMRYSRTFDQIFVPTAAGSAEDPLAPEREACTEATCDVRVVKLRLPVGTSWGRFRVTVEAPPELKPAVHLYDRRGALVTSADAMRNDGSHTCCDDTTYVLEIKDGKLLKGTYTLVVFNRLGFGEFDAVVEWYAHPPDRLL